MRGLPSRTLGQTSDLVVLAPWKTEIIGAGEAILPMSRWALAFRALYQIRRSAREFAEPQAFSDPVERLEQVHSFRMKATPQGMLLSVTYDFGWDPYMRALWKDAGPFLDLLLCDCRGYRLTREVGLKEWADWIRGYEQVSDYFYSATSLTVGDLMTLPQAELLQRDEADPWVADRLLADFASRTPMAIAADNRARAPAASMQQGLGILSAMFRLTRFYGASITPSDPLSGDAYTLLLATRGLLVGFNPDDVPALERVRLARELAWYTQPDPVPPQKPLPPPPPALDRADIQRGILSGYDKEGAITHGAVLFMMVTDAAEARVSLSGLADMVSSEAPDTRPGDGIFRNIAFTWPGMMRLGLPDRVLAAMPDALREGAAARAGQVGDMRAFHPQRWRPLPMNWPNRAPGPGRPLRTADIGLVDILIQLRTSKAATPSDIHEPGHPLHAEVARIAAMRGIKLLSVQSTGPAVPGEPGLDHFGLKDGISQPAIDDRPAQAWSDTVAPGEILLGYPNDANDKPEAEPAVRGGSFLAVRAMAVRPSRFDQMLAQAVKATGLSRELIVGKILGRAADGTPLVPHQGPNDFLYADESGGSPAPRQSHIRRANPRKGPRVPRLVRRGMSFVPDPGPQIAPDEKGSLFMAYCASLAEQYEVVLRWINGANSTRIPSMMSDPLCGPPESARTRTFRFAHQGKSYRFQLPSAREAPVLLSWSLYLFAPPISLLKALGRAGFRDEEAIVSPARPENPPIAPLDGLSPAQLVDRLIADKAPRDSWRRFLDEPGAQSSGLQAAIWKVIREKHGGVLRTADMVLVGSHKLVAEVLRDDGRRFSVSGAGGRIVDSIEKFHLGLDAYAPDYAREAPACNFALLEVTEAEAFEAARKAVRAVLGELLQGRTPPLRMDLMRDLLEPAVARMAPDWFGLPDGEFILPGPADWRPVAQRKPLFPGDYWNSSRYAFNPFTSADTERLSADHGKALLKATRAWIAANGRSKIGGTVTRAIADYKSSAGEPAFPTDHDLARGIAGSMLGWIATTLGNAARILVDWVPSGNLQRFQLLWDDMPEKDAAAARALFGRSLEEKLCRAPVPENKWRMVQKPDEMLGGKHIGGEEPVMMVLGLQSAAADRLAEGELDSYIPFGWAGRGERASHGCPGRDMALGVLLGVMSGLMEMVSFRDGGGRLVVDIIPRP